MENKWESLDWKTKRDIKRKCINSVKREVGGEVDFEEYRAEHFRVLFDDFGNLKWFKWGCDPVVQRYYELIIDQIDIEYHGGDQ